VPRTVGGIHEHQQEPEEPVINLDGMAPSELRKFWQRYHRPTRKDVEALVGAHHADSVTTLAAYALAKAIAMDARAAGQLGTATVYEQHCDVYFKTLPAELRW
jgi:hypothetical protein